MREYSGGSTSAVKQKTWTTTQLSKNVFQISIPLQENSSWEFWCLVTSDRHWDNIHSDRELQEKHLKQAVERGAAIIDLGDCLDLMGGKFDKRADKAALRPEHKTTNYIDAVIEDAARWFSPYAQNFVTFGQGNHESAVTHKSEINPTERLVAILNATTGSRIFNGRYSGWIEFSFRSPRKNSRDVVYRQIANYHHGLSSGKTSSNVSAHEKRAAYVPDADLILTGHSHNFWSELVARSRLAIGGQVYQDTQLHLGLPSYKDEFAEGSEGWCVEKAFRPKALGAWWIRFFWNRETQRVEFEPIKAQ